MAYAQSPVSPRKRLADLQGMYERHAFGDTVYLNAVDSIAPALYSNDSLEQWLGAYQQIAFGDSSYGRHRLNYWMYLTYAAFTGNRYGSALYYEEKSDEENLRQGKTAKDALSRSEVLALTLYAMNKDYMRFFQKYHELRPRLLAMPGLISAGKADPDAVSWAFNMVEALSSVALDREKDTANKVKDTAGVEEAVRDCEGMLAAIRRQPGKYKPYRTYFDWIHHMIRYDRESLLKHTARALEQLDSCAQELQSKGFLESALGGAVFDTYSAAFDFYFGRNNKDSARHYLDLIRDSQMGYVDYLNVKLPFLLESGSRLEASEGQYGAAYRDLRRAYDTKDSAFFAVSSDKDNNLYALAKAEDTENVLLRTEAKRREAEWFNMVLFFLLVALALAGVTVFLVYRARQRQRLLNLRLSLARNFHDEIGPLLLYANTLVKKEQEDNPSPRLEELQGQMVHIMEGVRGISHDLKSSDLNTIGSFGREITILLEKIKATTQIDFTVSLGDGSRVLSQYQYTHLRKIVNELIGNSIKHAGCNSVHIRMEALEGYLTTRYSDNGKGFAPGGPGEGIGLRNMEERAALLRGTFQLKNAYPNGYSIDISIPLL